MELFSPKIEEKVLEFWKHNDVFKKSLKKRKNGKKFVFFEGPPFPNAKAHIGNVLTRCYKDIILRYKNMSGFNTVGRRSGWDVHGLPIELQLEKQLGLKGKSDIEKYGIEKFNVTAQEMVWGFKNDWDKLTERIGFWVDINDAYITSDPHYIESLWHVLAQIWNKKLLYQDFKIVPHCFRCGASLSNFEVAQGYDNITENSMYLKFKLRPDQKLKTEDGELKTGNNTYMISWTTTPWTLPGNAALAVGEKIKYEILTLKDGEVFIFAGNPRDFLNLEAPKEKSDFISGKNLVGLAYEPLFAASQLKSKASYKVYPADFVNVEEGTGIVHIAPMYGMDDFNLGNSVGLPKIHTVNPEGKFIEDFGAGLENLTVKSSQTENRITEFLKNSGRLLKIKKYEHDYPFCWRCKTPLLYYAKSSWFIRMEKLQKKLVDNNKKINWVPAHIKDGRFGEWLKEIKDWAISRERYWGTPLPLWRCEKCKNDYAIGSLAELDKLSLAKLNYYIFLRHGQAENNRIRIVSSWPENKVYNLTLKGAREIEKLIPEFRKKKIDLIFSSDLTRAKETARIIAGALNKKVVYDKRLREQNFGVYNGRPADEWRQLFDRESDKYLVKPAGGESLDDVKKRMMGFLKAMDKRYEGKNILIVSHANPILAAAGAYQGYKDEVAARFKRISKIDGRTGAVFEMSGHNWPYNKKGGLDLHRPYVDELKLKCENCSGAMKRLKYVIDVWFDSGAMPFAQVYWPFAQNQKSPPAPRLRRAGKIKNQNYCELEYPADFIAEGVDQTRGWFYTLHAVGALMGRGPAYKNVISLGHILDEKGEKMSKSKGNIIDPWEVINKYGIDALRWYFFTINPPGEPKRFTIRDVEDKLRRFVLTLSNVLIFYKTYTATKSDFKNPRSRTSLSLLDKWILSRLNQTIKVARQNLDKYEVTQAARPIDDFAGDLSRWWLRRSRKRFPEDGAASTVLKEILEILARLIAPFTPFLAEYVWRGLGNKESIHLADYPKTNAKLIDKKLEEQMNFAREIAAKGLALRAEAGIKVRQPLASLKIKNQKSKIKINDELLNIIKEEVNVKEVVFGEEFKLDTKITEELKEEGITRELTRRIQEMRKDGGLISKDSIKLYFKINDTGLKGVVERWQENLSSEVGAQKIEFVGMVKDGLLIDCHFEIENKDIWIGIQLLNTKYY